jgi:hypothetical protein
MSESVHNEDLLIRYLDGELNAAEKAAVEQRLQSDSAFREQYRDLQVALQAIRQLGTMQQVEGIHREMMQERKEQKQGARVFDMTKIIRYTLAVAASVLVLFIGVRLYLNAQLSPDRIYNEMFVDYNVANARAAGEQLSSIETLYQQKDYSGATSSARTLNLSAKDSLLIGLSYLHTENNAAAINWLHALSVTENEYRQDAEFYLALAYVKANDYSKSLPYLQKIYNNPAHLYHEQVSSDVIEKIKQLNDKK